MNTNSFIPEINAPILKASAAITAAVGANTNTVENVAISVVTTVMTPSVADPWWFWFFVSIPWGGVASFLAAFYSAMVAGEWLWKKVFKPMAIRLGWMKPVPRRVLTAKEIAERLAQLDTEQSVL